VDIRHTPSENDCIMLNYIRNAGFEPLVVATKADKLNRSQINKHRKIIKETLSLQSIDQIVPYSSMTKQGFEEIWKEIDQWLEFANEPNEEDGVIFEYRDESESDDEQE
jgi:GTP-binding protein